MDTETDLPHLSEILVNRRQARTARDVRMLTSGEHWTREIAELRQQHRAGPRPTEMATGPG